MKNIRSIRATLKGKPISEQHKRAISEANKGENNGRAKLNAPKVKIIKRLLKANELSNEAIGKMFLVSRHAISFIKNGERWAHVKIDKVISQEEIAEVEKMVNL